MAATLQEVKDRELHEYLVGGENYRRDFRQRHVEALAALKNSNGAGNTETKRLSEVAAFMTKLANAHRKHATSTFCEVLKSLESGETA